MSDFSMILREIGLAAVAEATNRTVRQVYKWEKRETLPRSDFTGETFLAKAIAEASKGRFTEKQILDAAMNGRRRNSQNEA